MRIIGITGGTGAGKSVLSAELKKCGATIIDADAISRQVTAKNGAAFDEIIKCFGAEVVAESGELDRKKLGGIVFSDAKKLELLEAITHKHIFNEIQSELDRCTTEIAVMDVPLLFSSYFPFKCDVTVAVIADEETRLGRIVKRDGISRADAVLRMKNQMSNEEYKRFADICFENTGDIKKVKEFAKKLCFEL